MSSLIISPLAVKRDNNPFLISSVSAAPSVNVANAFYNSKKLLRIKVYLAKLTALVDAEIILS
jgi:hypothetical protein